MVISNKIIYAIFGLFAVASCTTAPSATRTETQPTFIQELNTRAVTRSFERGASTSVNFGFDQDTLSDQAKAVLDQQAEWIMKYPEVRFSVFGHTDQAGRTPYNEGLGMRRANQVMAYLMSKGISPDRLEALVSYGEELPIIDTGGSEPVNRRTVTEVSGSIAPPAAERDEDPVTIISAPKPPKEEPPKEEPPKEEPPKEEEPEQEEPRYPDEEEEEEQEHEEENEGEHEYD